MKKVTNFLNNTSHKLLIFPLSLFVILRFPSLFEPYWYGDEGIYQIIGRALSQGRFLYEGVWDNKPPLLYLVYALFNGDQFSVRLISLIVGIFIIILFYLLTKIILKKSALTNTLTILFAILFGSPYLEGNIANAENFMLFFIFSGLYLILPHLLSIKNDFRYFYIKNTIVSLITGGIMLGISFMFKTVGIFDLLAVLIFLFFLSLPFRQLIRQSFFIIIGFIIPWSIISGIFLLSGRIQYYLTATFFSNVSYVGHENYFIVPQGLLFLKLLLLVVSLSVLFLKRKTFTHPTLFVLIWVIFSLFNSFFSHRSYTHYVLLSLPSVLLLGGILVNQYKKNIVPIVLFISLIIFLIIHFKPYPLSKSIAYYPNFLSYFLGQKSQTDYQRFFDSDVPSDYAIAEYLNLKLKKNEEVLIYGNSAQIYVLSDTLPISRFTVAYHVNNPQAISEMQQAIITKQPKYIVLMPDEKLGEISLPNYTYRLNLGETAIYEYTY